MPTEIGIPKGIIEDIPIAVERLRIRWPHRTLGLLLLVAAQLEPKAHAPRRSVMLAELTHKARLMEVHRQRHRIATTNRRRTMCNLRADPYP